MAYSKQTWTDDASAVLDTRMNHIEQGVYDNSLATDKINPSGTATTTAEIEEGQVNDVIGFKSLKLKGQTSQYTTTGKNLLIPFATTTQSSNGITRTTNSDGSVTLSGTATANSYLRITENITLESNTAYTTLNQNANTPNGVTIYYNDLSNIGVAYNDTAIIPNSRVKSYTTGTVTGVITIAILIQSGTSFSTPVTLYPMLVKGTVTTSNIPTYEPYTGGKASPNPDYPQDVNNVSGDNVVDISNENLLKTKLSTTTQSGVTLTNNGDGTYTLNGTNSSSGTITFRINQSNGVSSDLQDYEDGTYTLDLGIAIPNVQMCLTQDATYTNFIVTGYGIRLKSGTLSNATNTFIYIAIRTGTTINNVTIQPMLVKGNYTTSTIPTFIAHQGNEFEINFTKNLFDSEKYLENASISNNIIVSSNNNNLFYIPVQYGRNYTMSFVDNGVSGNILYGFSNDKPAIGGACTYNILDITQLNKHTFTPVSANNKYLCIRLNVVNTNQYLAMENIQVEVGNQATEYIAYNENPIELCKIGIHQDYIYKKDGKWYKYKAIEKIILNGTESWVLDGALTNTNRFRTSITSYNTQNIALASNGFSNQLQIINAYSDDSEHLYTYKPSSVMHLYVFYTKTRCADLAGLQTWLSANNLIIYGILNTPIEEEITYTPLIRQLDELYNSGLYDVTNISQDNSSEAFILDIEACKNNINGIVEYIRR